MDVPIYVSIIFILTTVFTVALFYRTCARVSPSIANKILVGLVAWIALQGILAANDFYMKTDTMPPRLALAVVPAFITIIYLLVTKKGQNFIDRLPLKDLTLIHICRVPVEIVLFWLYLHEQIPRSMTFEGRNFDILSGLTALPLALWAFKNSELKWNINLIWNFICLMLVLNVVAIGILSAPTPFQQFAFNQPNIGVLKFPFVWLPSMIVPIVIFSHLIAIRQLLNAKKTPSVNFANFSTM
jgi:hypothetical protein